MEHIYLIVWRGGGSWKPETGAVFTDKRLADNFAECKNAQKDGFEYRVVEGVILPAPETKAEANARIGEFV